MNRSRKKKLWDPSKDRHVYSLHLVDGEHTELNPSPTLHMGYDSHKKQSFFLLLGYNVKSNICSTKTLFRVVERGKWDQRKIT